ncbi:unnamed protein product, partial [Coregonus sp. 'balchen']
STLQTRPLLYLVNLFHVLDLTSFFISEAKGEKLGSNVTILLSLSVLLLILTTMPSIANNLPVIAPYCIIIFSLTGFSLLKTMLVRFLIDMDSRVDKDTQTSAKTCDETPEVTGYQREPERDPESSLEKVEDTLNQKDLNGDWLNNLCLLQLILDEAGMVLC